MCPGERLPDAKANEFYWADLIGLRVVNTQNHEFGRVVRMVETGANDVLVVADQDWQRSRNADSFHCGC